MARNIKEQDTVYVPCSKFEQLLDYPTAFYKTKVVEVQGKKIKVNLPGQVVSEFFGVSLAHETVGLLIVSIGDFETEGTLIDPLSKSVLQYARLLIPDDSLLHVKLRSLVELKTYWQRDQAAYSHVVIIGHGSKDGIKFGVDGWVSAEKLQQEVLRVWGGNKKTIVSLCCQTGFKSFGGKLSSYAQCKFFIGPYHSVHGAVASQFCQTFLAYHLLEGQTVVIAYKNARDAVPGSTSFKLWENNKVKTGSRKKANKKAQPNADVTAD